MAAIRHCLILDATPPKSSGLRLEQVTWTVHHPCSFTSVLVSAAATSISARKERAGIKPGDLVMLEAMGGRLPWGASLIGL